MGCESIIKSSAADELENFEMVDSYEDDHDYWVYYRISKEAHAKNRQFREREREYLAFFETVFDGQDDIIGVLAVTGNVIEGADMFASNRLFR